jgi:recyclin-1
LLSKSGQGKSRIKTNAIFHGRLPRDLYDLILVHLPVFDIPQFSRCSRTLARIVKDGDHWEYRWKALGVQQNGLGPILNDLEQQVINSNATKTTTPIAGPATIEVESEDDFGEFSMVSLVNSTSGMFPSPASNGFLIPTPTNAFTILGPRPVVPLPTQATSNLANRPQFIRAFTLIKKFLLPSLSSPPHLILSSLFPPPNRHSIEHQSRVLLLLLVFLSSYVQPVRDWYTLRTTLKGAADRFEANLLSSFEFAYGKNDEMAMKETASAGWRVWQGARSPKEQEKVRDWEIGRVWIEKQEVFYDAGQMDSLRNFSSVGYLMLTIHFIFIATCSGKRMLSNSTLWMNLSQI